MPIHDPAHRQFVADEVARLLSVGAIAVSSTQPRLVHPIGVAENNGKLRLILDARFLNLWTPSPPMRYESLR